MKKKKKKPNGEHRISILFFCAPRVIQGAIKFPQSDGHKGTVAPIFLKCMTMLIWTSSNSKAQAA